MKVKSLILGLCVSVFGAAEAVTVHTHPKADVSLSKTANKKNGAPGYCQIEIANYSHSPVRVHEQFDDGATDSFVIYPFEMPHIIDLYDYYYGVCHEYMHLLIKSTDYPYYTVYSGYTHVGASIRIGSSNNRLKAEVETK